MFINVSDIHKVKEQFDYCIVGSGPAGITTAITLGKAGKRILFLEAGDENYTEESQSVYKGKVI